MGFLGKIAGSLFKSVLPKILPFAAGPLGGIAINLFKDVLGSAINKSGNGQGLFSPTLSLPNPLSALNGLLGGIGKGFSGVGDFLDKIGDFLKGERTLENGTQVNVPSLRERAASTSSQASGIGRDISSGRFPASTTGGRGSDSILDQVGGSFPKKPSMAGLNPKDDMAMLKYQEDMQAYNRMITMLTNLIQMDHDAKKSVIQNFRA